MYQQATKTRFFSYITVCNPLQTVIIER